LLGFFLLASIKGNSEIKLKDVLLTVGIAFVYAISDEIHQLFVPGRFSSIKDVLVDLMGILLAILIYPKGKIEKVSK
jgi:VanZ family protein